MADDAVLFDALMEEHRAVGAYFWSLLFRESPSVSHRKYEEVIRTHDLVVDLLEGGDDDEGQPTPRA